MALNGVLQCASSLSKCGYSRRTVSLDETEFLVRMKRPSPSFPIFPLVTVSLLTPKEGRVGRESRSRLSSGPYDSFKTQMAVPLCLRSDSGTDSSHFRVSDLLVLSRVTDQPTGKKD